MNKRSIVPVKKRGPVKPEVLVTFWKPGPDDVEVPKKALDAIKRQLVEQPHRILQFGRLVVLGSDDVEVRLYCR